MLSYRSNIFIYVTKLINKNNLTFHEYYINFRCHFQLNSTHAQSAVNLINNLIFACLDEDCFRYLTGGKMIKYVLHYLLFLTLLKKAEIVQGPCGSFWGGNPKHSSFSAQRAAPMTHLYWRRGFILFGGSKIWDLSICSPAWHCECWRQGTSPPFD